LSTSIVVSNTWHGYWSLTVGQWRRNGQLLTTGWSDEIQEDRAGKKQTDGPGELLRMNESPWQRVMMMMMMTMSRGDVAATTY